MNFKNLIHNPWGIRQSEFRGSLVLVFIILISLAFPYIYEYLNPPANSIDPNLLKALNKKEELQAVYPKKPKLKYRNKTTKNEFISKKPFYAKKQREKKVIPILDLNHADSADLTLLKGIGPIIASRIIKYGRKLGGWYSTAQLSEVYGIDSSLLKQVQSYTTCDTTRLKKININDADYKTLINHPYLRKNIAGDILKFKKYNGKINSLNELISNNIISEDLALKIKPYLNF